LIGMRARLLSAVTFAVVSLATGTALGNGRFPFANQLVVDPGDETHLVLRTTYGVLQSDDAGKHWTWLCEKSVGYGGVLDPAMGVTSDGTILAGVFDGLSISHDRGCNWSFAPGPLEKQFVIDVAVEARTPKNAVAVTGSAATDAGTAVVVAQTSDDGKTWTAAGVPLPADFTAETIEVAPSDPNRLYVSGFFGTPHVATIERSDDRGATWTRLPIPIAGSDTPYIGAVDPLDADRVYVRIDADGADSLVFTSDGGKTWKLATTFVAEMLGFAISPDGSRIAAGGTKDGVKIASKATMNFQQTGHIQVRCLTWSTRGLYACAAEFPDLFTVGLSTDEGASFEQLYHLADLTEKECPASSMTGKFCPEGWSSVRDLLGIGGDDGGFVEDGATLDADAGGGSKPGERTDSGCGCGVPGSVSGPVALVASTIALGLLAARRRRRLPYP
jgi:MYXO-CTERM domain-containing protein